MQTAKQILHGYLRLYRSISEEYRGQFGTVTLTFPQTLVLSLLSAEGPMPISELAKATGQCQQHHLRRAGPAGAMELNPAHPFREGSPGGLRGAGAAL